MGESDNIWYRLGYTLERSRGTSVPDRLRTLAERGKELVGGDEDEEKGRRPTGQADEDDDGTLSLLVTLGAGTLAARLLRAWRPRRRPSPVGLVRGALAGAGAAYLQRLLSPLLEGRMALEPWDDDIADALVEGVAHGLLYAALLDGRLPGGPLSRGVLYGAIEYVVAPWGGVEGLLGKHAPHRRIPVVRDVVTTDRSDGARGSFADELTFAVALALLYGNQGVPVPPEVDGDGADG